MPSFNVLFPFKRQDLANVAHSGLKLRYLQLWGLQMYGQYPTVGFDEKKLVNQPFCTQIQKKTIAVRRMTKTRMLVTLFCNDENSDTALLN